MEIIRHVKYSTTEAMVLVCTLSESLPRNRMNWMHRHLYTHPKVKIKILELPLSRDVANIHMCTYLICVRAPIEYTNILFAFQQVTRVHSREHFFIRTSVHPCKSKYTHTYTARAFV